MWQNISEKIKKYVLYILFCFKSSMKKCLFKSIYGTLGFQYR